MIGAVLKIAMRALARNKGRSALTMLGIIIGVASVIAMVGLGQGAQKQVQQQIESMGTNMLIISAGSQRTGGVAAGAGTSTTLTPDDLDAILRDAPAVSAISPSVSVPVTLVFGNGNWSTRAEGVAPSNLGDSQPVRRFGRVLYRRRRPHGRPCGGDRSDGRARTLCRQRSGRSDCSRSQSAVPRRRSARRRRARRNGDRTRTIRC